MVCQNCGFVNEEQAVFCTSCGTKLSANNASNLTSAPIQAPAYTPAYTPAPVPTQTQTSAPASDKSVKIAIWVIVGFLAVALISALCVGGVQYWNYTQQIKQQEQDNLFAAQEADALIASIGNVTLDSGDKITQARTYFDSLTSEQQELVSNQAELISAEAAYEQLKAEKAAKDKAEAEAKAKEEAEAKAKAEAEAKAKAEAEAMEAAAEDSLVMPAAVSYCGHYKVVTKDIDSGLYQRQGPSMDDSIIAFLKNGTVVPVYAWSGEWAYISYNNKNGWVNSRYLTKN